MEQPPINQRLNFLADSLADSVRAFGLAIGDNSSNAHKYVKGDTRPSPDFLEKVLTHFSNINARWLLTGEGEPFLADAPTGGNGAVSNNKKISRSLFVGGNVGRDATQNQGASAVELAAAKREIELLKEQVADKERMIQLLLSK
jgi:hypothetical protein